MIQFLNRIAQAGAPALRWIGLVIAVGVVLWAAWCAFLLVAAFLMTWGPHD